MSVQYFIVIAIIVAAVAYATVMLVRKRRSFSGKPGCASDCGCGEASKKLPS